MTHDTLRADLAAMSRVAADFQREAIAARAERDALAAQNAELRQALDTIHANAAESAEWIRRRIASALEGAK